MSVYYNEKREWDWGINMRKNGQRPIATECRRTREFGSLSAIGRERIRVNGRPLKKLSRKSITWRHRFYSLSGG